MNTIILVLMIIESGGNVNAVNGDAYGVLQIRKICWSDVRNGVFDAEKLFDPEYSRSVCIDYLNRWAPDGASAEDMARIWYGGPNGHKKASTIEYGKKFSRLYDHMNLSETQWKVINAASFLYLGRRPVNLTEMLEAVKFLNKIIENNEILKV